MVTGGPGGVGGAAGLPYLRSLPALTRVLPSPCPAASLRSLCWLPRRGAGRREPFLASPSAGGGQHRWEHRAHCG